MKSGTKPTQFWITPGATVTEAGREFIILNVVDLNCFFAKDVETGRKVLLKIGDIKPPRAVGAQADAISSHPDFLDVTDYDWEVAKNRRDWIEPLLLGRYERNNAVYDKVAADAEVSRATIYRWVAAYRATGTLTSLLPMYSNRGGKAKARIKPEVDAIIAKVIAEFYDTDQHNTKSATVVEIRRLCSNANLPLPAVNTIRKRLDESDGPKRTLVRYGEEVAYAKHQLSKGKIPDAEWPLSLVQMDHTLLPVIIVDDTHRKSIKRAWITLAIDVYSRVCLGMYLSLEAPSSMSAGMCIGHAILPKDEWLRRRGIDTVTWDAWGVMGILHMDNAREFRGEMLKAACKVYDIDIHLRPVKKPRYGAHIERLMGTVSEGLKTLKGATFSGPAELYQYDPEGNACMTMAELEKWLVLFFARYHLEVHSGLGMSPLEKMREGYLGTKTKPGRGLPPRRTDEEELRINFTPFIERTIQNYGVVIDDVHYYHDILRAWIGQKDPKHPKQSRLFRFHRDPRDISSLYFYDEISHRYVSIPYRDISLPPVSIWELRHAQGLAESRGISKENEKAVFAIINEQRALEESAAAKTKVARREEQRRKEHEKTRVEKKQTMPSTSAPPKASAPPTVVRGYNPDDVQPMEDE